jgi:phage terminase large subunit GpA-like protein
MSSPANPIWSRSFGAGLVPPPGWTVDEWADRRRYLSRKGSASPGAWDTDRAPYQREIMRCLSADHPAETVVFMASAQVGKTEILLNWAGYTIDLRPAPLMLVLPTVGIAEDFSKQRVSGLVTDTPTIAERMGATKGRGASNTILNKEFPGGMLLLRGANSAAGLRSVPVQYLGMDEIDGYPRDVDGEGDPVKLAEARQRTFARRKTFYCSTPTIKGHSRIEEAFEETDKRRYYLPCPHCGHKQTLHFDQLKFDLKDPRNTAEYECEGCKELIPESTKGWWYELGDPKGEWIAENPTDDLSKVGFHINALYSPQGWYSWGQIAQEFCESRKNPVRLRVFVNTVLGETWEEKGEQPDWEKIYGRRERYPIGTVPEKAVLLTAGVDVQMDRLEVEVVGWGPGLESWSVDYQIIQGKPSDPATWAKLEEFRRKQYPHELGEYLTISCMAVDSGFSSQDVYRYCRQHHPAEVMAIKGSDRLDVPLSRPTRVDLTVSGRNIANGATLRTVGSSKLKAEFYGWLSMPLPEEGEDFPAGWCHFPEYGQDFFKQLCSEKLVVKMVRGRLNYAYEKVQDRNEALDCRVYARAAAVSLGVDYYTDIKWQSLRERLILQPETAPVRDTSRDYVRSERSDRGRRKGAFYE